MLVCLSIIQGKKMRKELSMRVTGGVVSFLRNLILNGNDKNKCDNLQWDAIIFILLGEGGKWIAYRRMNRSYRCSLHTFGNAYKNCYKWFRFVMRKLIGCKITTLYAHTHTHTQFQTKTIFRFGNGIFFCYFGEFSFVELNTLWCGHWFALI